MVFKAAKICSDLKKNITCICNPILAETVQVRSLQKFSKSKLLKI